MARAKTKRARHVPQRTCVGCRQVRAKRELIRIVRTLEGVVADPSGKLKGRGAYLHNQQSCWERGLKGALSKALKTSLTEADHQRLTVYLEQVPPDPVEEEEQAVDPPSKQ